MTAHPVGSGDRDAPVSPVTVEHRDAGGTAPSAPSDPTTTIQAMAGALNRMAAVADQLAEQEDLPSLAGGLARLREFRKAVTDVERHIENYVASLMPQDQVNLDDWLTLERRRGKTRRNWDWEAILRDDLEAHRWIHADTGEYVRDTLTSVVALTASVAPRVGALRDRGTQIDERCEESPGRTTVTVRGAGDG